MPEMTREIAASVLQRIEQSLFEDALAAVSAERTAHPDRTVYAAAFWLFYGDYSQIGQPCFAVGDEEHLVETGDPLIRWSPPDWRVSCWSNEVDPESSQSVYGQLDGEHREELWDWIYAEHLAAVCRVCHRLTETIRRDPAFGVAAQFVVAILEVREGDAFFERYVRRSVSPANLVAIDLLNPIR